MRGLALLSTLALLAYPLAVYFGLSRWGLGGVGGVLAVLFMLRLIGGGAAQFKQFKVVAWISGAAGLSLVLLSAIFRQAGWFLYYPVIVNVLMLVLFGSSLWQRQTMIERFARLKEPDLPERGVKYTRTVTGVWCAFFMINGSIAFITCFSSLEAWTLYNGLISYLLMGTLLYCRILGAPEIAK